MAEKSRDPFWRLSNPIMWGVLATAAVIVFGVWAANQSVCQTDFWGNQNCGGSKWSAFLEASPNEVGDTLAGFAGALAFVWLIATVWLQGQELAAQREELREQREATQDMARAMAAQAAIFEDEQRQRKEKEAKDQFEADLKLFVEVCREQQALCADGQLLMGGFYHQVSGLSDGYRFFRELTLSSGKHLYNLQMCEDESFSGFGVGEEFAYLDLIRILGRLNGLRVKLDQATAALHEQMGLGRIEQNIKEILARPEWKQSVSREVPA